MKAMILAAGFGTRLKPLTDKTPKPLIKVNGIPLIFYSLALLKKYRVKEIIINLHHLGDQIRDFLGDGKKFGMNFFYSFEKEILGTGGGIKYAQPLLGKSSFLVLNSDIICDITLGNLIKNHQTKKNVATLALMPKPPIKKFGGVFVNDDKKVVSFIEKTNLESYKTLFCGVHVLNPKVLTFLPKSKKSCIIRDGYVALLKKNNPIGGYFYDGFWSDCGDIKSIRKTEKILKKNKLSYSSQLEEFKKILD